MPAATTDRPPPVNHVFVDFENVHEIDLAIIGSQAVHFTLLLGARQTKLECVRIEHWQAILANQSPLYEPKVRAAAGGFA